MTALRVSALPASHDLSARQLRVWRAGARFGLTDYVILDGDAYVCTAPHRATVNDRPPSTVSWASYWEAALLPDVTYLVDDGDSLTEWVTDEDGTASPVGAASNGARLSGATSITLVLTDADGMVATTSTDPVSVTVPRHSSVPWPTMSQVTLLQFGSGSVTVVAGAGVSVVTPETLVLAKQYAAASLLYLGGDVWLLSGYLEAA